MRAFVFMALTACTAATSTVTDPVASVSAAASVSAPAPVPVSASASASASVPLTPSSRVVARAREEVSRGVSYDSTYVRLAYPNGDVDSQSGVCTDVVVRGYRAAGIDLQKLVHEDVVRNTASYDPWVKHPDSNIDHRRVGPLLTYLRRHAKSLAKDGDWQAGDIVVISFTACPSCGPQHVGVVSDKMGPRNIPLLIHNMGPTPREDDTLDAWTHLGHFRLL